MKVEGGKCWWLSLYLLGFGLKRVEGAWKKKSLGVAKGEGTE